jgi:hypothetical protein
VGCAPALEDRGAVESSIAMVVCSFRLAVVRSPEVLVAQPGSADSIYSTSLF